MAVVLVRDRRKDVHTSNAPGDHGLQIEIRLDGTHVVGHGELPLAARIDALVFGTPSGPSAGSRASLFKADEDGVVVVGSRHGRIKPLRDLPESLHISLRFLAIVFDVPQPERITEPNRVVAGVGIQIDPARQPDGILRQEGPTGLAARPIRHFLTLSR